MEVTTEARRHGGALDYHAKLAIGLFKKEFATNGTNGHQWDEFGCAEIRWANLLAQFVTIRAQINIKGIVRQLTQEVECASVPP